MKDAKCEGNTGTELAAPVGVSSGYSASRLNAVQHGILSRFSVLPWEDEAEYETLTSALTEEHAPAGPTETHLVVELAGVIWRKRRLRLAEHATYNRGLHETTGEYKKTAKSALVGSASHAFIKIDVETAIKAGTIDLPKELADLEADQKLTLTAIEQLSSKTNHAYEDALDLLFESTRDTWEEQLTWEPDDYNDDVAPYTPDATSLQRYLETEILPWYNTQRAQLIAQPLVRMQALGEALDPDKLERLGRYETQLDRKFERTLSTLIRLQELRHARLAGASRDDG